jgi:hypothetical protein
MEVPMLYNPDLVRDRSRLQYLIIEKWGGIDARANYFVQAQALRRQLDAVEYIERAFDDGKVAMAHHLAGNAGTVVLLAVDSQEQLGDYVKANPANARMRPDDRTVIPMGNWESGRETFIQLIRTVEALAGEEEQASVERKVRPFDDIRAR